MSSDVAKQAREQRAKEYLRKLGIDNRPHSFTLHEDIYISQIMVGFVEAESALRQSSQRDVVELCGIHRDATSLCPECQRVNGPASGKKVKKGNAFQPGHGPYSSPLGNYSGEE